MDDALPWRLRFRRPTAPEPQPQAPARSGGDGDDEPVLIGVVHGPVAVQMAEAALSDEGIPALVRHRRAGPSAILGATLSDAAEFWVPPPLVERARDTLIGIGVLRDEA